MEEEKKDLEKDDIRYLSREMRPIATSQHGKIKCPYCDSENLAFLTEYHKCIVARLLQIIFVVGFFIYLVPSISDLSKANTATLIVFCILIAFTQIYIFITESKTHVQCVCKDCGEVWLHN